MFKRVDHVVIAVNDLEASAALYGKTLGLKGGAVVESPALGVKHIVFDVGNAHVEIAQPVTESSPLSKFLKERGEGLYMIAIQVDDLKATVKALREKGARIIGDENAEDRVFYIHPKSTHGVLIQLMQ